jgi:hypothetical protein
VLLVEELISGHVIEQVAGQFQVPDDRDAHDVSAARMQAILAEADMAAPEADESDDELLARARRAATAEMQALFNEPGDES